VGQLQCKSTAKYELFVTFTSENKGRKICLIATGIVADFYIFRVIHILVIKKTENPAIINRIVGKDLPRPSNYL
jgi:hypothetical protein